MKENAYRAFYDSLERCPIIASINSDELLKMATKSSCEIVYVLYGNICTIRQITEEIHRAGKTAVVHADLIDGLASREISIDYLKDHAGADGIISTKPHLIRRGNELDLITIQRFFMLDRLFYHNIKRYVRETSPDFVELLPAGLTKMIRFAVEELSGAPLIASGLILDRSDVVGALSAGAIAVSTTNTDVWGEIE